MLVSRLRSAFALFALCSVPLVAVAQTPPPPAAAPAPAASGAPAMGGHHGRHHHSFMHALKSVSLTPDQQKQVDAFKAQEAKANAGADRSTKEANAAKMRQQIMGILTPDQKAQVQDAMHGSSAMSAGAMSAVTPAPH